MEGLLNLFIPQHNLKQSKPISKKTKMGHVYLGMI